MSKKKEATDLRLKLPSDLKLRIRKFRFKTLEWKEPITSDAKAMLYLADRGLEAESLS